MSANKPKFNQGIDMLEKFNSKLNDSTKIFGKIPELGQITTVILKLVLEQ